MIEYYHKKTKEAKVLIWVTKDFEKDSVNTAYEQPVWAAQKLKEELAIGKEIKYKPFWLIHVAVYQIHNYS
jgi:hypothetical protein